MGRKKKNKVGKGKLITKRRGAKGVAGQMTNGTHVCGQDTVQVRSGGLSGHTQTKCRLYVTLSRRDL